MRTCKWFWDTFPTSPNLCIRFPRFLRPSFQREKQKQTGLTNSKSQRESSPAAVKCLRGGQWEQPNRRPLQIGRGLNLTFMKGKASDRRPPLSLARLIPEGVRHLRAPVKILFPILETSVLKSSCHSTAVSTACEIFLTIHNALAWLF